MSSSQAKLVNAGLFQVTWFACVLGGSSGNVLWGVAPVGAMLWLSARADLLSDDLLLGGLAGVLGFALDSLWIHLGVLDYAGAKVAPLWIVLMWIGVGLCMNHSLAVFQSRPLAGGLLAGCAAPLSYLAGERLGGVDVPDPWLLGVVAVAWFGTFWMGFRFAAVLARRAQAASASGVVRR